MTAKNPDNDPRLNMGKQSDQEWVSKTEFVRWLRCPYVFWLVETGQIKAEDAWTSIQARLIAEGREFQESVVGALPIAEGIRSLTDAIAQDARVLGLREVCRNERLKILGIPDGVDAAGGALFPIEIKSHKEVLASDRLELAFYYLLLEPYRIRAVDTPKGYIWLRREDGDAYVEVTLEPHHFARVLETLEEIRMARRTWVEPRMHSCAVCQSRPEVLRSVETRKDVSLIHGIGYHYAGRLNRIGIRTYEDLVEADPEAVALGLKEGQNVVGAATVRRWIAHAMSVIHGGPVACGEGQLPPLENFLSFDMEWDDVTGSVWLVGARIENGGRGQYLFLWEDTPRKERTKIVEAILDAAAVNIPVITWSGIGAEFTRKRTSIPGLDLNRMLAALRPCHLDAYLFMTRNVRLPIPRMTLKHVARHFRIRRRSSIVDGLEANAIYAKFRKAKGTRRERLRRELQKYNQDDLDCAIQAAWKMQEILTRLGPAERGSDAIGARPEMVVVEAVAASSARDGSDELVSGR